jgi:hypothetical protein
MSDYSDEFYTNDSEQKPIVLYDFLIQRDIKSATDFLKNLKVSRFAKITGLVPSIDDWVYQNILYHDKKGNTPLMIATENGFSDIVKRILDSKILNHQAVLQSLMIATRRQNKNIVIIILKSMHHDKVRDIAEQYGINPELKKSTLYDLIYTRIISN